MTLKRSNTGVQTVLQSEFSWNFDDTMANTSGTTVDFGATNVVSTTFDVIDLPPGAVVVGGELITETAFDAATYNVSVGDSGSATRYMAATDKKSTGRTALTPTGAHGTGLPIRITVVAADVCTTGKATLRVQFTIDNRVTEQV